MAFQNANLTVKLPGLKFLNDLLILGEEIRILNRAPRLCMSFLTPHYHCSLMSLHSCLSLHFNLISSTVPQRCCVQSPVFAHAVHVSGMLFCSLLPPASLTAQSSAPNHFLGRFSDLPHLVMPFYHMHLEYNFCYYQFIIMYLFIVVII